MRIDKRIYTSLTLAILFILITSADVKREAVIILDAERDNEPIPLITKLSPGLTLDRANEIQSEYVNLKSGGDKSCGYKAGLTSKGVQERFGVSTPVSGVLFSSGKFVSPASIEGSKYRSPVIETEIGFVIGKTIKSKITDTGRLIDHIGAVMPVVEIPETGFADMKGLTAEDIVAANVGSSLFITGAQLPIDGTNLDNVTVSLISGRETLSEGRGSDSMGGQMEALLWLVNSVIDKGYKIEQGSILITGALGKVVPAAPGRYEARYAGFGSIKFEVK